MNHKINYKGDEGASANVSVTRHSPDYGFCKKPYYWKVTATTFGKASNILPKNHKANIVPQPLSIMAPNLLFYNELGWTGLPERIL